MKRFTIFISFIIFILKVSSVEGGDAESKTLPFWVEDFNVSKEGMIAEDFNTSREGMVYDSVKIPKQVDIKYNKIKNIVKDIRDQLCSINQDGSYEVWLSVSVDAAVAISLTSESGIKAIIKCKTKK